jgi:hypothetical protein
MDLEQLATLFDLLQDLTSALTTLGEEAQEFRKEHTALRQPVEHIQVAVSFYVGTS